MASAVAPYCFFLSVATFSRPFNSNSESNSLGTSSRGSSGWALPELDSRQPGRSMPSGHSSTWTARLARNSTSSEIAADAPATVPGPATGLEPRVVGASPTANTQMMVGLEATHEASSGLASPAIGVTRPSHARPPETTRTSEPMQLWARDGGRLITECATSSAKPAPRILWYLDGRRLTGRSNQLAPGDSGFPAARDLRVRTHLAGRAEEQISADGEKGKLKSNESRGAKELRREVIWDPAGKYVIESREQAVAGQLESELQALDAEEQDKLMDAGSKTCFNKL
ncbi:unnamed protein product [Protopolystoma xenopodis]|uniref:Ig-like domain-containing protein n=1 Tax=Protopolystoma xenopodis TaxID=117903 RepID=A0A448XNQ4_9PLAT|nr:unnamed protein product [Protopolystoma xenopodis]